MIRPFVVLAFFATFGYNGWRPEPINNEVAYIKDGRQCGDIFRQDNLGFHYETLISGGAKHQTEDVQETFVAAVFAVEQECK